MGRALEEMRDALEGKKYVEEYVQALTHEIKSPLSAIRGAAELLEEEMPAGERGPASWATSAPRAAAAGPGRPAAELAAAGDPQGLEERRAGLTWPTLAARWPETPGPQLAQKGLAPGQPGAAPACRVRGEPFLLRQALANLLQNAIDFTPAGGTITLAGSAGAGGVTLTVADTGPGVPDYALGRVFERFYSLQRPGTRQKSSGLGLAIVREVAELHGGTATLENRPAGGAIATLTFPAAI